MYSFTHCHFCKEHLYKGNCKNPNCEQIHEYQTYPDIKVVDFYIGNYVIECTFNEDYTPKNMKIFQQGYREEAIVLDYHIEVNQDNYLKFANKIEQLQMFK